MKVSITHLDGRYELYYRNGKKYCSIEYKNGMEIGKHYYYFKSGALLYEYNFDIYPKENQYTNHIKEYNKKGELVYYGCWSQYRKADWVFLPIGKKSEDVKETNQIGFGINPDIFKH